MATLLYLPSGGYNEHMKDTRPSWDEYFFQILDAVAGRSTCDRGRVGCVVARDKRLLATGYAGSPQGCTHCDEAGHEMHKVVQENGTESMHCIRTTHAEQNAIAHAARFGIALEGATLYCNLTPCYTCAKMIINCGIVKVIARKDYHAGVRTKEIFAESGIAFELLHNETETYENQ